MQTVFPAAFGTFRYLGASSPKALLAPQPPQHDRRGQPGPAPLPGQQFDRTAGVSLDLGERIGDAAPVGEGGLGQPGKVAYFPDGLAASPGAGGSPSVARWAARDQQPVEAPVTLGVGGNQVARAAATLDTKLRAVGMVLSRCLIWRRCGRPLVS